MSSGYAIILTMCLFTIFPVFLGMIWSMVESEDYTFAGCWFAGLMVELCLFSVGLLIYGIYELLKSL